MKVALGGIFEISSGGTPSKTHAEYYDGNIPWVKTGDLKSEYLNSVDEYITDEGLKNSSAKMYEPGTVLLAMYGATIGAASILTFNACTNQACAAFKPCKYVIPEYLYYFLLSRREKFIHDGVGGAQPNISGRYLKQVEFELYPINEQRFVISVLDRVNRIISLKKEEIKKLDELIKARFIEMFGDPISNTKGWNMVELGELTGIGSSKRIFEKEYVSEGIPFYRTKEIVELSKGNNISTELYISEERFAEIKEQYGVPKAGDLLISAVGTIGIIWIVDGKNDFYFKDGNLIRVDGSDTFDSIYMKNLLEHLISEYKKQMSSGTAYAALTISGMTKMKVYDVPLNLQVQFSDFVKQVDKSKVAIQKSLAETQLLFDKLMQDYFG